MIFVLMFERFVALFVISNRPTTVPGRPLDPGVVRTGPFPIFVGSLKKVKSLNHLVRFNHLNAFIEFLH